MQRVNSSRRISRRRVLAGGASLFTGAFLDRRHLNAADSSYPPVRTITRGPAHHWFGYYDKFQFDPTNRFVLSGQVAFEHRTPRPDDVIKVGMVDTANGDEWLELGESRAWGWQQGCMLQWRPGTKSEILWNDRDGDRYVCRLLDVETRKRRALPSPVYTVSADGSFGLAADFARIQVMRPGYGYVGLADSHADDLAPKDSGVFRVNLDGGEPKLILSLADIARIPHQGVVLEKRWHYFNHLLIAPDSKRFIVLHRWRSRHQETGMPTGGFSTRMITANVDGSDVYVLDPSGHTSHFIWRDPEHVCMWTRPQGKKAAFYLFRDRTRDVEVVGEGVMRHNGHNTYVPGTDNAWILNDTYPGKDRKQRPYLYHVPSQCRVELGAFLSPRVYTGEWRCDTHPRSSRDGRRVCIDSPHLGGGRQLHLIDVSKIID
jgi:hypothetical protein